MTITALKNSAAGTRAGLLIDHANREKATNGPEMARNAYQLTSGKPQRAVFGVYNKRLNKNDLLITESGNNGTTPLKQAARPTTAVAYLTTASTETARTAPVAGQDPRQDASSQARRQRSGGGCESRSKLVIIKQVPIFKFAVIDSRSAFNGIFHLINIAIVVLGQEDPGYRIDLSVLHIALPKLLVSSVCFFNKTPCQSR